MESAESNDEANDRVASSRQSASSQNAATNPNGPSPDTPTEDKTTHASYRYHDYAGSQSLSDDAASDNRYDPYTTKAAYGGANGMPATAGNNHQCQQTPHHQVAQDQAAVNYTYPYGSSTANKSPANISALRRHALEFNRSLFGTASVNSNSNNPAVVDLESAASSSRTIANGDILRMQKFPAKLASILSRPEWNDIITWMPHGRSWKVIKPHDFETLIMPLFFDHSNYHSFNRLVNAWSFRRMSSGPDRGSYYHEMFLRGRPNLHRHMRRLPKNRKKEIMNKKDQPDFYIMPYLEDPTPASCLAARGAPAPPAHAVPAAPSFASTLTGLSTTTLPSHAPHTHGIDTTAAAATVAGIGAYHPTFDPSLPSLLGIPGQAAGRLGVGGIDGPHDARSYMPNMSGNMTEMALRQEADRLHFQADRMRLLSGLPVHVSPSGHLLCGIEPRIGGMGGLMQHLPAQSSNPYQSYHQAMAPQLPSIPATPATGYINDNSHLKQIQQIQEQLQPHIAGPPAYHNTLGVAEPAHPQQKHRREDQGQPNNNN
eukprot:CAMPEP_0178499112 /NCGR_PEP_ID=MMETSP0696-20121128/15645_1 /TAXON_ID=265572 /ORGANISM="Extubocellulus spinifer, Strain CCMP396" /LENGTH=541 /DNA_ID=CAMNT_0020127777 /DNA_START=134 /DNA_END=1759 /DNA_ORIENTATION=-